MCHTFEPTLVSDLMTSVLECVWVKIVIGNRQVLVGSCYRKSSSSNLYFENIVKNLQLALSFNLLTILMGDFNFNYSSLDSYNHAHLIELYCQMKQLITEPLVALLVVDPILTMITFWLI